MTNMMLNGNTLIEASTLDLDIIKRPPDNNIENNVTNINAEPTTPNSTILSIYPLSTLKAESAPE